MGRIEIAMVRTSVTVTSFDDTIAVSHSKFFPPGNEKNGS
jgi:hypothetical protein